MIVTDCLFQTNRHPEPRVARARFLQRSSRGEGPFVLGFSSRIDDYRHLDTVDSISRNGPAVLRASVPGVPNEPDFGLRCKRSFRKVSR